MNLILLLEITLSNLYKIQGGKTPRTANLA
jgi:hypothetical protein